MNRLKRFINKYSFIKLPLTYLREIFWLFSCYTYDLKRFFLHGGWRKRLHKDDERNYYSMFLYHGVEKSLSYKHRNPSSGWRHIEQLSKNLEAAHRSGNLGYHDIAAKQVILDFLNLPENLNDHRSSSIRNQLQLISTNSPDEHGVLLKTKDELQLGMLEYPEHFFYSRYSLRHFDDRTVQNDLINRAIHLAQKTPSVCNRQSWHIYHTANKKIRDIALELQNGNRGFGHTIPNLLIVTADLKGFLTTSERNQLWIDGGMYLMSLIYAFHSLGISCCPLNWAQTPKYDKKIRKQLNIRDNHSIVCMLAVGYPRNENFVCASSRVPSYSVSTELKEK